jgi:ferredoxin
VDPAYLAARWGTWTSAGPPPSVFLCGPEDFMTAAEEFLTGRGIAIDDIRKESFDLVLNDDDGEPDLLVPEDCEEAPAECTRLTAVIGGEHLEVTPADGEPLLAALLRVSDEVPYSCQEGTCSSCIVRLAGGQVRIRPGVLQTLRPADLKDGLILACLSRARSASVHIDFDDI